MRTKAFIWIIFLFAVCSSICATNICEDQLPVGNNCSMISPPINCNTYSIFLKNGTQIENGTMTQISTYFYQVNFSQGEGDYYVVLCDNIQSREIRVTSEGESKMIIAVTILLPIIFGIILLVAGISLGQHHAPIKYFTFFMAVISFWASMHFAMLGVVKFYNFPELQSLIGSTVYWTGWVFAILLTYFLIYIFYSVIHMAAQRKKERLEY